MTAIASLPVQGGARVTEIILGGTGRGRPAPHPADEPNHLTKRVCSACQVLRAPSFKSCLELPTLF